MARLASFDIARGIAIICVVLGHMGASDIPDVVTRFCFSFHMPLFFLVSGYFLRKGTPLDRATVAKEARALLLPYAVTSLILIACVTGAVLYARGPADAASEALSYLVAALYGAGAEVDGLPPGVIPVGAIWFLWALFWARLIVVAANRTGRPELIVVPLFVITWMVDADDLWLPLSIQAGMGASLFVYLGQLARERDFLGWAARRPAVVVAALAVWAWCIVNCGHLYMVECTYNDGLLDVAGALCGSLCVMRLSQFIEGRLRATSAALGHIGRITLPIFCMHLVELTAFPYRRLFEATGLAGVDLVPTWVLLFAVRCLVIAAMCLVLYALPRPISGVFYASRRPAPREAPANASQSSTM